MEENTQLTTTNPAEENFVLRQRQATAICKSDLVPDAFKGNVQNTMIAMEIGERVGLSAIMCMQNLYIVHGKPSWSSKFVISKVNTCGLFARPLRFEYSGEGDTRECYAHTVAQDGEICKGPVVSIKMAKLEGWYDKKGSKWPSMPDVMLSYRAASFFGSLYIPELLLGMKTAEEMQDNPVIDVDHEEIMSKIKSRKTQGETIQI